MSTGASAKTAALIVAAGQGTRAGGALPKQWQMVAGRRVADWTVDVFDRHAEIDLIVLLVAPDSDPALWPRAQHTELSIITGGQTRAETVQIGLDHCQAQQFERVVIHDVARPGLPSEVLDAVLNQIRPGHGAAPALAVTDALWRGTDHVTGTVDRSGLWRAQTPQGFYLDDILAAHRAFQGTPADDVEVARAAKLAVAVVAGDEANLKITGPDDFQRAAAILGGSTIPIPDIRTGNGFDVHRFGPGDHVMLCGVPIPFDRGLQGHSDADVGLHTVTDAIYGALCAGDIGTHFPPSDPQWKGAESHIFLTHAVQMARDLGYALTHVDVTLLCEAPKIGPHAGAMRDKLSDLLGIEIARISVKATTTERLGFTGRGEGIAAMATATLVRACTE